MIDLLEFLAEAMAAASRLAGFNPRAVQLTKVLIINLHCSIKLGMHLQDLPLAQALINSTSQSNG